MADVEEAIVAQLLNRLSRLHEVRRFAVLGVSGGVAANTLVRERIPAWGRARGVDVRRRPARADGRQCRDDRVRGTLTAAFGAHGRGFGAVARSRWPLETLR